MRSINRNEVFLTYVALVLLILILHQRLLHHHDSLKYILAELRSTNAVLAKRTMDDPIPRTVEFQSPQEFLEALDDSPVQFDDLSISQRNETITFEFNGSTVQLWHMLQILRTISGISLEQLEFYETKPGIAGVIELRIMPK